jgi:hypothetical protein
MTAAKWDRYIAISARRVTPITHAIQRLDGLSVRYLTNSARTPRGRESGVSSSPTRRSNKFDALLGFDHSGLC